MNEQSVCDGCSEFVGFKALTPISCLGYSKLDEHNLMYCCNCLNAWKVGIECAFEYHDRCRNVLAQLRIPEKCQTIQN
jgi:hypothetical protein